MYRMMFLKGVHVTKAGPDRILPRIIKTLEDNPETYNRDRVIHTNTEREMWYKVVRKKDAENRQMQIQNNKGVDREELIFFLFCPPTPTGHTVVLLVSFWSSVGWFTPKYFPSFCSGSYLYSFKEVQSTDNSQSCLIMIKGKKTPQPSKWLQCASFAHSVGWKWEQRKLLGSE